MRAYCSKCGELIRCVPGGEMRARFSARRWFPEPHLAAGAPCDGARVPAGDVEFDAEGKPCPKP